MDEVAAERAAFAIFAVRVDVVVGDVVEAVGLAVAQRHAGLGGGECGVLRAEDDVVDFALARREVAVRGERARDVRGVAGILPADVQQDDVAILDFAAELIVVQHDGIGPGADDRRVGFRLAAAPIVNFDHARGDLILVQAGTHHFHRFEMRVHGNVNRMLHQRQLAGRFHQAHGADGFARVFPFFLRDVASLSQSSSSCSWG